MNGRSATAARNRHRWAAAPCLSLVLIAIASSEGAMGFSTRPFVATRASLGCGRGRCVQTPLHMAAEIKAPEEAVKQVDSNGNEFVKGAVVRVSASIKAYQVPAKGHGKFDPETKEFILAPEGGKRGDKCLEIPVGLRGVVTRVYDIKNVHASHPVQVKFISGQNADEGFDSPVTFLMHFDSHELECVV